MSRKIAGIALALFALAAAAAGQSNPQTPAASPRIVDLKAPDGTNLKASYFAASRPGPGILLFHACNRDRASWNELAAAAAARGFHVLAMDYRGYGQSGGTRSDDPQQQQWIAEREWPGDIEAAFDWLSSQPGVDKTRIGAAGASCGVNQSVQLARRHPEVKTVVLLSGGIAQNGREFLRDSSWLPVLAAASHGDGGAVETMRWATGWSRNPKNKFLEYQAAGHGTDMFAVEKDLQPQVLAWFETHLRDAPATRPAASTPTTPTAVEEFWTALNAPGGVERARTIYDAAKARDKAVVLFPETEMNLLGYRLLQDGNAKDALTVFQMNVESYPHSANVYDSLSDAHLELGNREEALKLAQKALETLEKDTNAPPEFKQLVRQSAERKIKELQAVRK